MRRSLRMLGCTAAIIAGGASGVCAQTWLVPLDTALTTAVDMPAVDTARVRVPAAIAFTVTNVAVSTAAPAAAVSIDQIVILPLRQLRVSVRADGASFRAPASGATTWLATDVSWNAASWSAAVASAGTLSQGSYNTVALCTQTVIACSTSALVFTLAAKPAVKRSGAHTLVITWKFESF